MCGISGIICQKKINDNQQKELQKMAEIQSHRGPDSTGFAFFDKVLLAHNRLAILDLNERAN